MHVALRELFLEIVYVVEITGKAEAALLHRGARHLCRGQPTSLAYISKRRETISLSPAFGGKPYAARTAASFA